LNFSLIPIFLLAGFLGSIPFGLVVTIGLKKSDPRKGGSKNIGATNVLRTSGWTSGLITLACDIAKGATSVAFIPSVMGAEGHVYAAEIAAIGAVLGHMYSPFTRFRGGKGVATGLGVFALLTPIPTIGAALVFLVAVLCTRFVSLGSILAAITVPALSGIYGYSPETTAAASLIAAWVVWRHQDNIRRLLQGEENRFGSKSKPA
jgi:glycerol-3-phosphate acyltransferase PlsY